MYYFSEQNNKFETVKVDAEDMHNVAYKNIKDELDSLKVVVPQQTPISNESERLKAEYDKIKTELEELN